MLTIRYLRSGKANSAFFRIVLTEKSKPCNSGFIKVLGWYNPHSKKTSLKKEEILEYINKGAIASNSVAKLLLSEGVKHKNIKYVPDAPRAKKEKSAQGGEGSEKQKMPLKEDKEEAKADESISPEEPAKETEVAPEDEAKKPSEPEKPAEEKPESAPEAPAETETPEEKK